MSTGVGRFFKRTWKRDDGTIVSSRFFSIAFPYKGRQRVEGTKAETEAEARKALRQRLEQISRQEFSPGKVPTVREAATSWIEGKKVSKSKRGGPVKLSTLRFWQNHIDHYIKKDLGDYRMDRIDTALVEKATDIWAEKSSSQSANRILQTLGMIYKKQLALGVLRFNPVEFAERLAVGNYEVNASIGGGVGSSPDLEVSPEEVYSPDELRRLIEAAKPGLDQTMLATAALTMIRHGELLGLMWGDVDFEAKEITIRRSWGGEYRGLGSVTSGVRNAHADISDRGDLGDVSHGSTELGRRVPIFWVPKTKSSIRKVPIPDQLCILLKKWRLQNAPGSHDLVFAKGDGSPYYRNAALRALIASCEASGLRRLTIHALRHTGASIHLMKGTSLPEVSAMLGHSNVNITLTVYTHFLPKMRDPANKLAEAVFGGKDDCLQDRR